MLKGQPTLALLNAIEAAIAAIPVGPATYELVLFTGNPTLTENTVLSDLTQPTYTGYASVPLTAGTVRRDGAGNVILPLGTATFQPTADPPSTITVTGVGIITGTTLYLAEYLDVPWVITSDLDALDVVVEWVVTNGAYYGAVCTVC